MKRIISVLVFMIWMPSFAFGDVSLPFTDDFESYSIGSALPSPWITGAGGPALVTDQQAYRGFKSATPVFPFGSSVLELGTEYTDYLQYEGWVYYMPGSAGIIGFHEQFSNMLPAFNAVRFQSAGEVRFESADNDTGFYITIATNITTGWHHVRVQLNFADLLANVWFDDLQVLGSVSISPKEWVVYGNYGAGPLRHIGFSNYNFSGPAIYFDDFSVSNFLMMDIKPGSDPNSINIKSQGVIPVALLGNADFSVMEIDVFTLNFESASPAHDLSDLETYEDHLKDINGDGFQDLITHYWTQDTGISCGDISVSITGQTNTGQPFFSVDSIKTVGCN